MFVILMMIFVVMNYFWTIFIIKLVKIKRKSKLLSFNFKYDINLY